VSVRVCVHSVAGDIRFTLLIVYSKVVSDTEYLWYVNRNPKIIFESDGTRRDMDPFLIISFGNMCLTPGQLLRTDL
jgi:hypothetical protein